MCTHRRWITLDCWRGGENLSRFALYRSVLPVDEIKKQHTKALSIANCLLRHVWIIDLLAPEIVGSSHEEFFQLCEQLPSPEAHEAAFKSKWKFFGLGMNANSQLQRSSYCDIAQVTRQVISNSVCEVAQTVCYSLLNYRCCILH